MIDSPENSGANIQKAALFKDWSLYRSDIISPQLPKNIKYTPPKANEDLRKRIKPIEGNLNVENKAVLQISLAFLERGIMEDNYEKDNTEREKFLLSQKIKIGDEEITLYELKKRTTKLSGSAINRIITAGQMSGNSDIGKKSIELMKIANTIKKERGFFLVSDLEQFDNLALSIIEHYLSQQNLPSSEAKQ